MLSKLPSVEVSIFSKMSALASEYGAYNLAQGFPEYSGPPELTDLVSSYMRTGKNQYAPSAGVLELRNEISKLVFSCYKRNICKDTEVVVTTGATQAIFTAIQSLVFPGDEVVLFEPAYDSYIPSITLCGGIPIPVEMKAPNFTIDWSEVKNRITEKTKLIIINNPHNPTGTVFSENDLFELESIVEQNKNLYLLADEVYEHLVDSTILHQSVHKFHRLHSKSFIVSSFGKTFHNTGWKIGYIIGSKPLIDEFKKVHQFTVFSVNTPIQMALAEFMNTYNAYNTLYERIKPMKTLTENLFSNSNFKVLPNKSTYFQLIDYSLVSHKSDVEFTLDLVKNAGVATIPLTPFYSNQLSKNYIFRLCIAKNEEVIKEGIQSIVKYNSL